MASYIARRKFLAKLGGAAAAWPLAARAQQRERMRRIGLLLGGTEDDAVRQTHVHSLREGLRELRWEEGRNLQIEYRWEPPIFDVFAPTQSSWSA